MNAIRRTFRPVARFGRTVPPKRRRSAVLLAHKIGLTAAAYVFGVSVSAVDRWRREDASQHAPNPNAAPD